MEENPEKLRVCIETRNAMHKGLRSPESCIVLSSTYRLEDNRNGAT